MSKIIDDNIPFLRNLRLAAEANSEEDLNPLFDMLDPDPDSKKMGKTFNDVLGYNPITYYTEEAAHSVFSDANDMLKDYPKTVDELKKREDEIVSDLVVNTENTRAQYAYFGIKGKIRNMIREVGEVPPPMIDQVMDSLERKYNLNYKERPIRSNDDNPRERDVRSEENKLGEQRFRPESNKSSFECTRNHPIQVRGIPTQEDNDDIDELEKTEYRADYKADLYDDDMDEESDSVETFKKYYEDDDDSEPYNYDDDDDGLSEVDPYAFEEEESDSDVSTNDYWI